MKWSRLSIITVAMVGVCLPLFAQSSYDDLVKFDQEFFEFAKPRMRGTRPNYGDPNLKSTAEMKAQKAGLEKFKQRLRAMDTSSWSVPEKVDYLLVWARLNQLDFAHRVLKPWVRDPMRYYDRVSRLPFTEVPIPTAEQAEFGARLKAVPGIMKEAETNLTEARGELASLAIFHLENYDGVGQREPFRAAPPDGTIGWYKDLCARLQQDGSDLVADCQKASAAVAGYRDWLKANFDKMPFSAAVGNDNFTWYIRNVRLLPYTIDDVKLLGKRELDRFRWAYIVDRAKNQHLPELELTQSAEQHEARTRLAEMQIRTTIEQLNLMTIPDYMPPEFETDTYWSPRAETRRHFWEELQFRNAINNHVHASIPGHRFDNEMRARITNPIRKTYRDTPRGEGWGTYLEELFIQAGITDNNPRAKELNYIALIKRGSRVFAETGMHSGEMTLDQANQYMIRFVPFMEENLGRYDLKNYLRTPGSGSSYLMGKIQIEQLVSERAFQLGDKFDLGEFHDDFLSRGVIPVTLIRWEMTGLDDEVMELWPEIVGSAASDD